MSDPEAEFHSEFDNPAGRLLSILQAFSDRASKDETTLTTWSRVLNCSEDTVLLYLAQVAGMVPDIRSVVERSGDKRQAELFEHFWAQWMEPIYFATYDGTTTPSPGKGLIELGSLQALGSLSAFLSATKSEGSIPSHATLEDLRSRVADLVSDFTSQSEIPAAFRSKLVDHLRRLLWAIDHFRIVGPDGVQAAVDRMMVDISRDASGDSTAKARLGALASGIYRVFKSGSEVNEALEGWTEVVAELPPG